MSRRGSRRGRLIPLTVAAFLAGAAAGWSLRGPVGRTIALRVADRPLPTGTTGDVPLAPNPTDRGESGTTAPDESPPPPRADGDAAAALEEKELAPPITGVDVGVMRGQFADRRDGGARGHEAVDILAPRDTPVHAVEDGTIAKLFLSKPGGITVYQFDPTGRFCYYYAHLERYAPGLHEGQHVARGEVIGYVGTSGNAPPNTPHLHFAIFELTPERHWWQGTPIDPWIAFSH